MESTHLLYFKAIAESGSLTKASKNLFISQPALSKCLTNLERELGCNLFNRVGGRLYLNSEGKVLLEYANQIDKIFEQIRDHFTPREPAPEGLTLYSTGNYFSFILKNYFQFDTSPINLKIVPNAQIAEALFSADADIAIADDRYLRLSPEMGLKRIPFLNEQLLLMIPKNHPLSGRTSVDINELTKYPLMRLNTNYWIDEIASSCQVKLNIPWSVDNATWDYYWNNYSDDFPLMVDTSASFVSQDTLQARRRICHIASINGASTNRMLYLWYFKENEGRLGAFINCVKMSFMM